LAKALVCERGPSRPEPCNVCEQCVAGHRGPLGRRIEIDGASNNSVDEHPRADASRSTTSRRSLRKKVYVIDEVHMLTTEAFNALLKTLEEPPAHVTFVLATTEPHKVPVTILSRCQRYDFKLVPSARLHAHLTRVFAAEGLDRRPGGAVADRPRVGRLGARRAVAVRSGDLVRRHAGRSRRPTSPTSSASPIAR
jgi:DNA polymerase-3 subunit gamma/tau